MIRWAIKDYFARFRWGKIKEQNLNTFWVYIYFVTVLPMVSSLYENGKNALTYLLVIFPLLFCMFAASLRTGELPKMMYLSPMSYEMRKKYIFISMAVRVGFPILIGAVGIIVLLILGICNWICAIGILVNIIAFSICLGGRASGYGRVEKNGVRGMDAHSSAGRVEIASLIVAFIAGMIFPMVMGLERYEGWNEFAWELQLIVTCATVVLHVPIIIMFVEHIRVSVEIATHYEGSGALQQKEA